MCFVPATFEIAAFALFAPKILGVTLNEALRLYGGKITIADGVEIISKENSSADIKISAGVEEITDLKDVSWTTYDIGTNVEIGDANIGTMSNPISDITIKADKTTLDKTDVVVNGNDNSRHNILIGSKITDINSSKLLNRSGDIFIANISRGSWSYDNDGSIKTFEAEADPNYEVAIRNSNINTVKAKDITIIGGNVTLDHSQLNSGKDIFVGAVKTYDSKEGVRTATTYDNSVINADKDTVVHARGHAEAYGANLNIQAKKFDNVIDSTNPIVKYIGKDGVSLWELMPYIDKEGDINLDYYYNNLNGKTLDELIMMQLDNRKKGIIDKDLDAIIEYLQKKANEQNEHISSDDVNKNNTEKDEASDNPWGMDDLFVDLLDGGGEFLTEGEGKLYNTLNIGENVGKLTVDVCKLGRVIFKKDIPEEEKRDAMSEVVKSTGELVGSIWEAGHEKGAGKIFSCVTKLITDASSIDYAHLLEMSPQERTEVGGKLMKDALELNPLADNDPLNNFLKGIVDGVVYVGSNEYKNKVLADKQVTSDEIAKVPLIIFYQGLKSVPENTPWLKSGINATKTLVEKIITHSGENIGGGNGGGGGAAGGR